MNKLWLALILLFITPTLASVDYTQTSCLNTTTLQTEYFTDNGTGNTTTAYDYLGCQYGCNNGACKDPIGEFSYAGLVITCFIAFGLVCVFIINTFAKEEESLKMLFFFIALFMLVGAALVAGIIGSDYIGTAIEGISNTILGVSTTLLYVISFLIAYVLIMWIKNVVSSIGK
jgi:hypothetical protein